MTLETSTSQSNHLADVGVPLKTSVLRAGGGGGIRRSDRVLEFFGRSEGNLFAGLDLNLLAGGRIPAHAGSTIPRL
jgi:hypothetical protein